MEVNGKFYPMWGNFVENKSKFIGGILDESGDSVDRALGFENAQTIITDITLEPNGDDSAYFSVVGEKFSCGFDVHHGGVTMGEHGWITFSGYGGHSWRIKSKAELEHLSAIS